MANDSNDSDLLDIKQAARVLAISEHNLRQLCRAKKIKHMRVGNKGWLYRFRLQWLDDYMAGAVVEITQKTPAPKLARPRRTAKQRPKSFRDMANAGNHGVATVKPAIRKDVIAAPVHCFVRRFRINQ